ncbi:MAG: hypothetical protein LBF74_01320, partial [Treponema sp.]|nr:hypothetical protein [Treponema sp.]
TAPEICSTPASSLRRASSLNNNCLAMFLFSSGLWSVYYRRLGQNPVFGRAFYQRWPVLYEYGLIPPLQTEGYL